MATLLVSAIPMGDPRRATALYCYNATWDNTRREHTTQFKVRPNSVDEFDLGSASTKLILFSEALTFRRKKVSHDDPI